MFRQSMRVISFGLRNNIVNYKTLSKFPHTTSAASKKYVLCNNQEIMLTSKRKMFVIKHGKPESEVREIILRVCQEFEKVPKDKFTPEARFAEDFGLDSLDQVELIMAIEDEFEFEIPVQESEKMKTTNDIIAYVVKYMENYTEVTV